MPRLFFLALVAMFSLFVPRQAQACSCEDAWEEIIAPLWQGKVIEPLQTDAITCPELRYMRNIPYARHGFVFVENWTGWVGEKLLGDLRYHPNPTLNSDTVESMLTLADRQNIDVLVVAEAGMQCKAWWEKNGEDPAGWNFDQSEFEEIEPESAPVYATVEIVTLPVMDNSGQSISIVAGEATPSWLVGRAFEGKMIENEWLAPLSCDELSLVEDALYTRHGYDPMAVVYARWEQITVGRPTNLPLTREGAGRLFSSQDKLTQLRVNNAQRNRNCQERE